MPSEAGQAAHPPGVMVSSTFYDLRQHRDDLRRFLQDELGYRPLLSEHPSFPIDPDLNTIENCRERVRHDADVLVLVIGGRYGSVDDPSAKSVTNLEYLAARQKRIPIYAFVERGIIALLPVWKDNPTATFKQVDTPLLFQFVHQVRDLDRVWVQEFGNAHDIIDALRIQFAYAHSEGLALARRLRENRGEHWLDDVFGQTLRLALEKPHAWEYRLFASALRDAVARHHKLRKRHELGIPFGLGEDVHDPIPWFQARFQDGLRLAAAISKLFNEEIATAFGPDGKPGSAEKILFVAESIGELYRDAIRWAEKVRTANVHEDFRPVLPPLGRVMDLIIPAIEEFADAVVENFDAAVAAASSGTPQKVEMTLTISVPDGAIEEFNRELQRAAQKHFD